MDSRLKKIAMDFGDRDFAIAYINGEVFRARTHAACINKYLMSKSIECLNANRRRPDLSEINLLDNEDVDELLTHHDQEDLQILKDNITQLGFAHAVDGSNEDSGNYEEDGKYIYVEQTTLYNVDFNTVVNAIKQSYPDYEIRIEETEEKVAKLKKASMDFDNRYFALTYIDGEVLKGSTHAACINDYLISKNIKHLNTNKYRPHIDDINLLDNEDYTFTHNTEEDLQLIKNNIKTLGFAHVTEKGVFVEQSTLYNVDLNTVANAIKQSYPKYNVYIEETEEKIARLKKLNKNIKLAWTYETDTDENKNNIRKFAITYIDGEIFTGYTHYECIQKYLNQFNIQDDNNCQLAFAYMHVDGNVYLGSDMMQNLTQSDLPMISKKLKEEFPSSDILLDTVDSMSTKHKKIAKLHKSAMDVGDRDFAVAYIDGEIIEGPTHSACINEYLNSKNKKLNDTYYRPNLNLLKNKDFNNEDDLLENDEKEDLESIRDNIRQFAFAHGLDGRYDLHRKETDGKEIYIEQNTLYNVDLNVIIMAMKQKYPDYDILISETNKKIAGLRKVSWLEGYDKDRLEAIVYINGKVYSDRNHSGAICQYYEETDDQSDDYNVAVGYLCSDGNIYLAMDTLRNISGDDMDDVLLKIKEKYPNNDILQDSFYNKSDSNNGKKLARLKKCADEISNPNMGINWNDDMWNTYDEKLVKKQDTGLHKEWEFEEPTDNPEWIMQQD